MTRGTAVLLALIGACRAGYAWGLPGNQMWMAGGGGFLVGAFGPQAAAWDRQLAGGAK